MSDYTELAPERKTGTLSEATADTISPLAAGKPQPATGQSNSGRESIPELIRQLANDISTLTSKEMSLAKAEFREAANAAKAGVGGIAGGAGIALAGGLFIMLSITYGLAEVMPPWGAALTVGVVAVIVGIVMINAGKKKVEPDAFVPDRTIDSVRRDKETAKRAVS